MWALWLELKYTIPFSSWFFLDFLLLVHRTSLRPRRIGSTDAGKEIGMASRGSQSGRARLGALCTSSSLLCEETSQTECLSCLPHIVTHSGAVSALAYAIVAENCQRMLIVITLSLEKGCMEAVPKMRACKLVCHIRVCMHAYMRSRMHADMHWRHTKKTLANAQTQTCARKCRHRQCQRHTTAHARTETPKHTHASSQMHSHAARCGNITHGGFSCSKSPVFRTNNSRAEVARIILE